MKKLFLNSKGSMIPESAIVIPLIVLITAASMALMMDFYQMTLSETEENNRIFKEGFNEAESIRHGAMIGDLFNEEE